ncbi:hypothetical protein BDU57DRAFT_495717 [Ampelomyces quisqualis]|uniref:Pentatricopeptide repeat domain-containing protein n=1 Tax=Ampelomyces quisqualis TaxID=50730 RepID=A0A6A5QLS9_AMPQU|nr:hypothetical protein BDU57DRAFT_495717 [Ampelomyces quisqualis]
MPPALHRLLASPSALRLLRQIVHGPEVPAACLPAAFCCHSHAANKHTRHHATYRRNPAKAAWPKWGTKAAKEAERDQIRQFLEADAACPAHQDQGQFGTLTPGPKTFQKAPGRASAASWAALLSQRERQEGQWGIMAMWKLRQNAQYNLPVDSTAHADYLWGTFIKHPDLVSQVIDHAADLLRDKKRTYPDLYRLIMIYWLPRNTKNALQYHQSMLSKLDLKSLPLKLIAQYGHTNFPLSAYEVLLDLYRNRTNRNLYDAVVPSLIDRGHIPMARRWHNLCTSRGDLPSESVASHPVVRVFTVERSLLSESGAVPEHAAERDGRYNTNLMRRFWGRDTAPVRFDDSFCARMFATTTFPPESVIKGLAMVGVNEIGPQAVLTMASRTDPLEELPNRFEELRAHGIALQGCVFSLALEKFAQERKWSLVRSMLDSDQHPDVFGEAHVQRELLNFYLDQDDTIQAQRTLAILALFHNDSSQESWNLLLQTHIRRTGPQHVTEVLQDMRVRGVMVTLESIAAIKTLLRRRQRGRKPVTLVKNGYDDLRFVARVLMTVLEFGMGPVDPLAWREIIRRFGMMGRFRELRRLLLWLLCWYAPRSSVQFSSLPVSPFRERALERMRAAYPERNHYFHFPREVTQHDNELHPVRRLIPPSLQQALIIWGFRSGLLANANLEQSLLNAKFSKHHHRGRLQKQKLLQRVRWSIGLRTVVLLRQHGVYIHRHTVVKALQMQFIVLFGRGRSRKPENRCMENTNSLSYAHYVQEVNKYWGSRLFREPDQFHMGKINGHAWHPRIRRRTDRRASISLHEILEPDPENLLHEHYESRYNPGTAVYRELERTFAAQAACTVDQGPEWMHEASFDTTIARRSDARARTRVGVKQKPPLE